MRASATAGAPVTGVPPQRMQASHRRLYEVSVRTLPLRTEAGRGRVAAPSRLIGATSTRTDDRRSIPPPGPNLTAAARRHKTRRSAACWPRSRQSTGRARDRGLGLNAAQHQRRRHAQLAAPALPPDEPSRKGLGLTVLERRLADGAARRANVLTSLQQNVTVDCSFFVSCQHGAAAIPEPHPRFCRACDFTELSSLPSVVSVS
ncbi:hypothetical protein H6CHR_03982 [Variovorax sp. PBL-H6]|nr:hypothetical protein H6CHR_03982 [Variovorax sp. PBL-H6]